MTSRSSTIAKIFKGGSKIDNSSTTASSANTASAIVARDASGNFTAGTITAALSGNASTATVLQTARNIGGVSFNGSANIDLPGVNTTGNQNTSGSAATLTTGRNFSLTGPITAPAISFNGSGVVALATSITAGAVDSAALGSLSISSAKLQANIPDTKLATISTAGKVSNSATTASSSNTANAIVARDASGNFSAGTITASLSGNASTATTAGTVTTAAQPNITSVGTLTNLTSSGDVSGNYLKSTNSVGDEGGEILLAKPVTNTTLAGTGVTIDVYQNKLRIFEQGGTTRGAYIDLTAAAAGVATNLLGSSTPGDGTLTLAVSGTGLSGSASFTANQSTGSTFTVTSNATSANTTSAIVARDASGNFAAGTITAALTGNASTATTLQTARTIAISGDVTGTATSFNGSANITISAGITAGSVVSADFSSATSLIIYNSVGTAVKTVYSPGS